MASVTIYANKTAVIKARLSEKGYAAGEIAKTTRYAIDFFEPSSGDEVTVIGFNENDVPKGAIIQSATLYTTIKVDPPAGNPGINSWAIQGRTAEKQFDQNNVSWANIITTSLGYGSLSTGTISGNPPEDYTERKAEISTTTNGLIRAIKYGVVIWPVINFRGPNTNPGICYIYAANSSKKPRLELTYNPPNVKVTPGIVAGTYIAKNLPKAISWSMSWTGNDKMIGNPAQTSAEIRCKTGGTTKTVKVSGSSNTGTIPAGTFTADTAEIQIAINTTAGGYAESDWITVDTKEEITVFPGFTDGLFVPKNLDKQITWSIGWAKETITGTPVQVKAQVRCKNTVTKTIDVNGADTAAIIPAGTFVTGESGQIQIAVNTANGGYAESEWIAVNTMDQTGTAVAVSPRGIKIDGDTAQVFSWTYESPTGTPQTKAELQVSYDGGGRWQELATAQGDVRQTTIPAGTLEAGAAAWRVRCFNSDGSPGEYSDGAYIIVSKNPLAPSYVTTNARPRLVVEWASTGQQGYQVQITQNGKTVFDSGTLFGVDKQLTLPNFLSDGDFTASVRIIDKQGLWSDWTSIDGSVKNTPAEPISLASKSKWFGCKLEWYTEGEYQAFYLLRDGVPVGKSTSREWTDWTANGKHKYTVRAVKNDGYYTDSNDAVGVTSVPYGAICLWGDFSSWQVLKLHEGGPFAHSENRSAGIEYVQYAGRSLPVAYETGWKTVSHTVEYTVRKAAEWEALKAMEGRMVIYKDYRGARVIGMLESVDAEHTKRINFSLTIQETDVQERVAYD